MLDAGPGHRAGRAGIPPRRDHARRQVANPTFLDSLYTYAWFVTFGLSFVLYLASSRRVRISGCGSHPRSDRGASPCTPSTAARSSSRQTPRVKLGAIALATLREYAPDAATLAAALGLRARSRGTDLPADRGQARARAGRGLPHRLRGRLRQPLRRGGRRRRADRRGATSSRPEAPARCRRASASASRRSAAR